MNEGRNSRPEASSQQIKEKGFSVLSRGYCQEEETSWIVCLDNGGKLWKDAVLTKVVSATVVVKAGVAHLPKWWQVFLYHPYLLNPQNSSISSECHIRETIFCVITANQQCRFTIVHGFYFTQCVCMRSTECLHEIHWVFDTLSLYVFLLCTLALMLYIGDHSKAYLFIIIWKVNKHNQTTSNKL